MGRALTIYDLTLSSPVHTHPSPRLHFSKVPRGERRPIRCPFLEVGKLRPEPGSGRQGHPESRAQRRSGVQGSPEDAPHRSAARSGRGLTSSTTRPSGCPSAPTSRYTSGFPAEAEGSRAPPPLQVRAAGRRSGEERGTGRRLSRREPQRSASIATRVGGVGSGREIPGASGGNGREGHAHPGDRVPRRCAPLLWARQARGPAPAPPPPGLSAGDPCRPL